MVDEQRHIETQEMDVTSEKTPAFHNSYWQPKPAED